LFFLKDILLVFQVLAFCTPFFLYHQNRDGGESVSVVPD